MTDVVAAKPQSIFKSTHELAKMVRKLGKISAKAIDVLEKAMDSEDEKLRVMAAEKLLKFYVDSAKDVNTDKLNRLILDVKSSNLIGQGSTVQEDDNTPVLNFDQISPEFLQKEPTQSAGDIEEVEYVDMGSVNKI